MDGHWLVLAPILHLQLGRQVPESGFLMDRLQCQAAQQALRSRLKLPTPLVRGILQSRS